MFFYVFASHALPVAPAFPFSPIGPQVGIFIVSKARSCISPGLQLISGLSGTAIPTSCPGDPNTKCDTGVAASWYTCNFTGTLNYVRWGRVCGG